MGRPVLAMGGSMCVMDSQACIRVVQEGPELGDRPNKYEDTCPPASSPANISDIVNEQGCWTSMMTCTRQDSDKMIHRTPALCKARRSSGRLYSIVSRPKRRLVRPSSRNHIRIIVSFRGLGLCWTL